MKTYQKPLLEVVDMTADRAIAALRPVQSEIELEDSSNEE